MAENSAFKDKRGGARKGAGRKPGLESIKTRADFKRLVAQGETPLEVLLNYMRQAAQKGLAAMAIQCASIAAPYVHPRLAAVAVQGSVEVTLTQLVESALTREIPDMTLSNTELPKSMRSMNVLPHELDYPAEAKRLFDETPQAFQLDATGVYQPVENDLSDLA